MLLRLPQIFIFFLRHQRETFIFCCKNYIIAMNFSGGGTILKVGGPVWQGLQNVFKSVGGLTTMIYVGVDARAAHITSQ